VRLCSPSETAQSRRSKVRRGSRAPKRVRGSRRAPDTAEQTSASGAAKSRPVASGSAATSRPAVETLPKLSDNVVVAAAAAHAAAAAVGSVDSSVAQQKGVDTLTNVDGQASNSSSNSSGGAHAAKADGDKDDKDDQPIGGMPQWFFIGETCRQEAYAPGIAMQIEVMWANPSRWREELAIGDGRRVVVYNEDDVREFGDDDALLGVVVERRRDPSVRASRYATTLPPPEPATATSKARGGIGRMPPAVLEAMREQQARASIREQDDAALDVFALPAAATTAAAAAATPIEPTTVADNDVGTIDNDDDTNDGSDSNDKSDDVNVDVEQHSSNAAVENDKQQDSVAFPGEAPELSSSSSSSSSSAEANVVDKDDRAPAMTTREVVDDLLTVMHACGCIFTFRNTQ
jgi:hypothetical protein